MDEHTYQQLEATLPALQSLYNSLEHRHINEKNVKGMLSVSQRSYAVLHAKLSGLLPDDVYVTDALRLEAQPDTDLPEQFAELKMAATQLFFYVRSLVKQNRKTGGGAEFKFDFGKDMQAFGREMRDFGQEMQEQINQNIGHELRDQIMHSTRNALRRALEQIDGVPPVPPTPPHPSGAPIPPTPPSPPFGKGRVEIHIDDFDEDDDKTPKNPPPPPQVV